MIATLGQHAPDIRPEQTADARPWTMVHTFRSRDLIDSMGPQAGQYEKALPYLRALGRIGNAHSKDKLRAPINQLAYQYYEERGLKGSALVAEVANLTSYASMVWKYVSTTDGKRFDPSRTEQMVPQLGVTGLDPAFNVGIRRVMFNNFGETLSEAERSAYLAAAALKFKEVSRHQREEERQRGTLRRIEDLALMVVSALEKILAGFYRYGPYAAVAVPFLVLGALFLIYVAPGMFGRYRRARLA